MCSNNTFGVGCQPCDCQIGECNWETGCVCPRGRIGIKCEQGCDSGYYGDGCTLKCAEECIDGQCSPDNGLCDCNKDLVWNNGNCQIASVVISSTNTQTGDVKKVDTWIWAAVGGLLYATKTIQDNQGYQLRLFRPIRQLMLCAKPVVAARFQTIADHFHQSSHPVKTLMIH
ncbi:cell death abnormality protein 1-like isoform X2 [Corticium candelabrum]|uniref:cell death abnormality protein 1-like isoform X2 n=1 Tax=Corticium candelabrum TaxID=121492 RepID=UPI002E264C63|nr:cell death abnormality protein 1-like isoform X2 [Corticium candelabrum]